MRGLLGYRFLKLFAGDLKSRREYLATLLMDQRVETKIVLTVEKDCPDSKEDCENQSSNRNDE